MTSSIVRRLAAAGLVPLLAACAAPAPRVTPAPTTLPTPPAFENSNVDIGGGRTLHLVCVGPAGTTQPTVLFEGGLGDDAQTWAYVMSQLASTTRGCTYDRAGNGESPAAPGPRTTADQVDDVTQLLDAAGIRAPIVIVGWSLGGWNAMVFADRHPDRVAGIVLLDVRPPTASATWLAELPAEQPGESEALAENRDEFTAFEHDPTRNTEGLDLATSSAQAAAASFRGKPVRLLWAKDTAGFWENLDPELAGRLDGVLRTLRAEMEANAGANSRATLVDASHDIPGDAPQAVIDAVRGLLGAAAG